MTGGAHSNVYGTGADTVARCSCGQTYEGRTARRELKAHLLACPDEADAVDPSEETERWAATHYPITLTLDEYRKQVNP